MSAPATHDPLVVSLQDGSSWVRRALTRDGHGLYALAGSAAGAPNAVLATIPELAADHGLRGMAFALPMPVGPEPQAPTRGPLWSLLDWSLWGAGMGDVFRMPLADAMLAGVPAETRTQAEQIMADFIERRKIEKTGVTVWQEQRDELARLRTEIAELRTGRHSTNESLTLAAEALRENRDRLAGLATEAAKIRAVALKEAAEELMAACPEHGNADEAWMDCPCEFAEELVRKAALAEAGAR